jgi:hypothetical protein
MGFEVTDHDVDAPLDQFVSVLQHLVGFSDAGGKPQIHFQPAALVRRYVHGKPRDSGLGIRGWGKAQSIDPNP